VRVRVSVSVFRSPGDSPGYWAVNFVLLRGRVRAGASFWSSLLPQQHEESFMKASAAA